MPAAKTYLALDMGAESGRAISGTFDGDRLHVELQHRFPNRPVRVASGLHWDVLALFAGITDGLAAHVARYGSSLASIGVDTWGLDFALLAADDSLIGQPYHYRDQRTDGMFDAAFARVNREKIFDATGLQFMEMNTLYQLLAMRLAHAPALDAAATLLMIPDLFNFWLCGQKSSEWTIASTSQMCDPRRRTWHHELLAALDIPTHILPPIMEPGMALGPLWPRVANEAGILTTNVQVVVPACHDTGAAVAAVPATSSRFGYISSGTWSLVGTEVPQPVLDRAVLEGNLTNEGGVNGTTRLLQNVTGMWLVQECRRIWQRRGQSWSYADLSAAAETSQPFGPLIEPNAVDFVAPADMPAAIEAFCRRTGQQPPKDQGSVIRCCLESLALAYQRSFARIERVLGYELETIHIVGGGSQNALLCQLTADVCGKPVVAGPVEATALGNIIVQMQSAGDLASLVEARDLVRRSAETQQYMPRPDARWQEARARFAALSVTK